MKKKHFFLLFALLLSFWRCTSLNDGFLEDATDDNLIQYSESSPVLIKLSAESLQTFFFEFSKPIDISTAQFILSGELFKRLEQSNSKKNIWVHFTTPMNTETEYNLQWKGLKSQTGDLLPADSILFKLESDNDSPEEIPSTGSSIIFNEILFNPQTGGSEYIELYNNSNSTIDLSTLCLDKHTTGGRITHYSLETLSNYIQPKGYAVITKSKKGVELFFDLPMDAPIYEIAKFPQLSNEEGVYSIHSTATGERLDAIHYTKYWHTIPHKDTKGVALERIDMNGETDNLDNWRSADQTKGGSPGYANSKDGLDPDIDGGDDGDDDDNLDPEENDENCLIPEGIKTPVLNAQKDRYQVYYHLHQADCSARVIIFDYSGKAIMSLPIKEQLPKSGYLSWGVQNIDGVRLRPGIYIFYVEFYHENGSTYRFKRSFAVQ